MFAMYLFNFTQILTPFSWMEVSKHKVLHPSSKTKWEQKQKTLKFQEPLLVNLEMHFHLDKKFPCKILDFVLPQVIHLNPARCGWEDNSE